LSEPLDMSGLLSPNLEVRNEKGELVFSMKRKGQKYGQLYYIFEFHWDRADPKIIAKLNEAWEIMKYVAARIGIPLFDVNQIMGELEKAKERIKTLPMEGTTDISIPVIDHATGETHNLTVGVTKKPKTFLEE